MELPARLKDRSARIGVLGLGYVGLPLAIEFCRKGFLVKGFDVNRSHVAGLRAGRSHILDVAQAELSRFVRGRRFEPSADSRGLSHCDVVILCVQTPLRKSKEPEVSNILAASREVARRLRRGQLVVLESTIFPGGTDELVRPILEEGGRRLGRDFYLAYSPERVDPGNARWRIANTPKVVGGADLASARLARQLYAEIVEEVVPVSSTKAAEMAKLLENSFRAVNIAMVNEMAQVCRRLGLDVWEVIGAAATKPFGYMPFWPGPGIGGACIPKDPQLLTWKMNTLNFEARFLQLASNINNAMPRYTIERVAAILNADRKPLNGSRVLVLGVAYKPDTSDYRDSPALDVLQLLLEAKAVVSYHDPHVPVVRLGRRRLRSSPLTRSVLRRADLAAILTAHRSVDYPRVLSAARRVFDARNAVPRHAAGRVERL